MATDAVLRIAPTPSGYLHEGNAANALLTAWLARALQGRLALRIDDLDPDRYRREYADDIFATLEWLGIDVDEGPATVTEFEATGSALVRREYYRSQLLAVDRDAIELYACGCSRKSFAAGTPCTCRANGVTFTPGDNALRVHIPPGTTDVLDGVVIKLDVDPGDAVVWRRDDLAAYQFASVIDDRDLGTTHIVRGVDLRPSSALQRFIAPAFGAHQVRDVTLVHHELIVGPDGAKLSKSQLTRGPMDRTTHLRQSIVAHARALALSAGIPTP